MATLHFFYYFSLIVLASSAFLPFQDGSIPHHRLARSPHCWTCQQEYESSGYGGYNHPPHFHSQQWSGLSRSPDGSQQQVFSGAAASAAEGSQSSSEAFSLASAGSETKTKGTENQKEFALNNENRKYETQQNIAEDSKNKLNIDSDFQQQQQSQGDLPNNRDSTKQLQQQSLLNEGSNIQSVSTNVQQQQKHLGSSSNNGQYGHHEIINLPSEDKKKIEAEGQYGLLTQNNKRGDIEDNNVENPKRYFGRQYNTYNQQQQHLQYGPSAVISGNNEAPPVNYKASEAQYRQSLILGNSPRHHGNYGNSELSQSRSESGSLVNNENQQRLYDTRYLGNEQQSYKQGRNLFYNNQKYHNNVNSDKQELNKDDEQHKSQYSGYKSHVQNSVANEKNANSNLNGQSDIESGDSKVQQKESFSKDSSNHDTQSSLTGALSLASEGVQASQKLPEAGCTTCEGKGSIAYSNARSHSGSAVALSIGG